MADPGDNVPPLQLDSLACFVRVGMHLTNEQFGIYMKLLMYFWLNGPIPGDDDRLRRIAFVGGARWRRHIRPALVEFFDISQVGWIPSAGHIVEQQRLTGSAWAALRAAVFDRDGHACVQCTSTDDLECDHIMPVSRGGSNDIENLQTLCRFCNRLKRDLLPDEIEVRG